MRIFLQIYFALIIVLEIEGLYAKEEEEQLISSGPSSFLTSTGGTTSEENELVNHFSQSMNEKDRASLIEVLAMVKPEQMKNFEAAVYRFTKGIESDWIIRVIKVLANAELDHLTDDFETAVNHFTLGTSNECYRHWIIEALVKVKPENLEYFMDVADRLTQDIEEPNDNSEMPVTVEIDYQDGIEADSQRQNDRGSKVGEFGKVRVVEALAMVMPERLTRDFENAVKSLYTGNNGYFKASVIEALAIVVEPLEHFIDTVDCFAQSMNLVNRDLVIWGVAKVKPEQKENFEAAVNRFAEGMDEEYKAWVINGLAMVKPEHLTSDFEAAVKRLAQGVDGPMDGFNTSTLIRELGMVRSEGLKDFETVVNQLSQNMDGHLKVREIRALVDVKRENLEIFMQQFTDSVTQQLTACERINLTKRLSVMRPDEYQAEIEGTLRDKSVG